MSPPWMPLYIADYLRDTAHLQAAESGAYLHLIMAYWAAGGHLPNDDRQLAMIARMPPASWRRARPIVEAFFGSGFVSHKRIDRELSQAMNKYEKRAAAGKAGGLAAAKSKQASSNAVADVHQTQLHTPREEDIAPDGATNGHGKYAFESGIIRLSAKDLAKWEKAFSYLDLAAELTGLTKWAGDQGPENWFFAVSGALAKRNRELKTRADLVRKGGQLPLTPSGNQWPEGIV